MRIKYFLLFCSLTTFAIGQNTVDTLQKDRSNSIFGLPIVYVTPETSWAFGAAGIYSFYADRENPRPGTRLSQLQLAFAYTLNQQILFYLPYDVFTVGSTYRFNGELGFYKYTYFFYGIGNDSEDYPGESFGITFGRVRLNALRNTRKNLYLGLRYWMDNFQVTQVEEGGLLSDAATLGVNGGIVSGLGPMLQWDSRDQVFFPRKGAFSEVAFIVNNAVFGSDYSFSKFSFNGSGYLEIIPNTVLALNAYLEFNTGTVPFNQLALLGGTRRFRGYYEGRYRDNNLLILQGEWRFPVWKRIKATVFGGTGVVSARRSTLLSKSFRPSLGFGIRYLVLKKDQIHLRLDFAWGQKENSAFYLTIGEAF